MAQHSLPPISSLSGSATDVRAAALDLLFEPSVPLHTLSIDLLHTQTFSSYDELIERVGGQLSSLRESTSSSDTQWLDSILGAHPRLGEKKVDSAQSRAEQAQLNSGHESEAAQLKQLNEDYEATYPSLRYVCVHSLIPIKSIHVLISVQGVREWQTSACHHGGYATSYRKQ